MRARLRRLVRLALPLALAAMASPAPPLAAEDIVVGLAAPLTGRAAADGLAMQRALADAVREANAGGGLAGRTLTLMVEDDGCASASGEGAARVLVATDVAVVIGHPCSSAATAAAPVYAAAGRLFIAVGARDPRLTDGGTAAPVLRLAGRDDRQGAEAAAWLRTKASEGRVAIVHDRTRYARAVADGAEAALKAAGIEPAAVIGIVASHRAYDEELAKIDEVRAEAVLFAGFPDEAAILAAGLAAREPPIPMLGSDSLATPAFAKIAQGLRSPTSVLLPVEYPALGRRDRESTAQGARARGAFEAWLAAATRLGAADGAAVAQALRGAAQDTPTLGALRFDAQGDVEAASFAATAARGGRWTADQP